MSNTTIKQTTMSHTTKTTKSKRKVDKEKVRENTINRILLGKKKLYGDKRELAEEIWGISAICCDNCDIWLDYDDCVHYLEYGYLCQICGEGKEPDLCVKCDERPWDCYCSGCEC